MANTKPIINPHAFLGGIPTEKLQSTLKGVRIKHFVLDFDGVFTTGQFLYTKEGKYAKICGAHDNDGIKMIKKFVDICIITADKRGSEITKKRVEDMGLRLEIVSEPERIEWMKNNFDLSETVYMGDGIYDAELFPLVAYSIAPSNAFYTVCEKADYVTKCKSGEGAVLDACLHIIDKFFN